MSKESSVAHGADKIFLINMDLKRNFLVLKNSIIVTALLLLSCITLDATTLGDNNSYRHVKTLDPKGRDGTITVCKYVLEWLVDWDESRVIFNVTVETKGYVGFGLSRKGKMIGADIVVGGVTPDGQFYFSDRHAPSNQAPVEDASQDWTLHAASETDTHTFLSFSRPFETCDEQNDLPISKDHVALIWAYGETDNDGEFHYQNHGSYSAYLLDPDLTPYGIVAHQPSTDVIDPEGDVQIWTITGTQPMPAKDTTYMCTIHKAPGGAKKHIIGYNPILNTEVERRHIHHFLLYRCYPPEGQDAKTVFEPVLGYHELCYIPSQTTGQIPTGYCQELYHVSVVGQLPNFFPEHVGLPLSESANEYYLLSMHLDNPTKFPGLTVNFSLEIFYTEKLRRHDAGILDFGEFPPASSAIMVPPGSLAHVIYGHCGSECTAKVVPEEGIRLFAVELHTHLAGRGVRMVHIRDNIKLPWVLNDDNYRFDFQQIRTLTEERLVLPGDLLIHRCVYSNVDRKGNVTIGGLRSNERVEMIVTSPPSNAGLTVSEVGNYRMNWTIETRNQIQNYHRYLPQVTHCHPLVKPATTLSSDGNRDKINSDTEFVSVYRSDVVPYEPISICNKNPRHVNILAT